MRKFLIVILLLLSVGLKAQHTLSATSVDSVTYRHFITGNWDSLVSEGLIAIKQGIDFQFLRQRLGYAYFVKGDYYAAQYQYEKAWKFNPSDSISCQYLYYCGINTGNEFAARFYASRLSPWFRKLMKIRVINPVSFIDLEYNYKANTYDARSNPTYFRAGINTRLGYRFSLYQSASNYSQTINTYLVKQPDYFALFTWSMTARTNLSIAYHYLNTSIDGYKYPGNLIYGALNSRFKRFGFGVNGSYFKYDLGDFTQVGISCGYTKAGSAGLYFTTSVNGIIEQYNSRIVFSQLAGVRLYKSLWGQGFVTLGNIQNYTDHNALYLYNSIDPTVFRTGASLFWYAFRHFTFYGNYIYDNKQIEQTTDKYTQQSLLGGIIWKL